MDRKQAIEIIVANEYENLSFEDRKAMIFNAWGLDESDEVFHLLPYNLRQELINFEKPQADPTSSQYDALVKVLCEYSYSEYPNEKLAAVVSNILKRTVTVNGKQLKKYKCPCCGKMTLPFRGEYEICPNCGWEDDGIEEGEKYSNPNHMTLKQGKENYFLHGKCGVKDRK